MEACATHIVELFTIYFFTVVKYGAVETFLNRLGEQSKKGGPKMIISDVMLWPSMKVFARLCRDASGTTTSLSRESG